MLQGVDVGSLSLDAYRGIAPGDILDAVLDIAVDLKGARVLHVNATPYGGGVSEMLRSLVPLLNDVGLAAEWRIISGDPQFFEATKTLHNGLQGGVRALSTEDQAAYIASSERNARLMANDYDFVFVHDPQPAALLALEGKGSARWIWRCHIDTSEPNPSVWQFLKPFLVGYDAAVFTMPQFIPPDMPISELRIIQPAIDPLSPKNIRLPVDVARGILTWIGIDLNRPLITQVSRFDPWKDPLGVIAAYRLAREDVPGLQLALVGSMAFDDPQGWDIYREIMAEVESDPGVHVFTNLVGVSNVEVNAFQSLSNVIVQKSIREGFGLVVSEAMWKGTPVVAGRAGGIPFQMGGTGGVLVDGIDDCAGAIVSLVRDPALARTLGKRGRRRVRREFLLPRLLRDELLLMRDLSHSTSAAPQASHSVINDTGHSAPRSGPFRRSTS